MNHSSNVTSTILRWNSPIQSNIAWYKLFRITANDTTLFTDGSCIAQIPYTSCPSYTDVFTTLGDGTARWYALKSISWSDGSSAFSNVMSAVRTSGVSLSGPLVISGALTVSTLNVTANASVQGTMHISGAATFGGTVNVSGDLTLNSTWRFTEVGGQLHLQKNDGGWQTIIFFNL